VELDRRRRRHCRRGEVLGLDVSLALSDFNSQVTSMFLFPVMPLLISSILHWLL
jgi:hypothetical protein